MKKIILAIVFLVSIRDITNAQTAVDLHDTQSWNEIQLTVPMAKQIDFWTSVTMRFGKNITQLNDGRYAFGFILKPNKAWSFQPFYWYIDMRNARNQLRIENRFSLRINYHFPFKSFGLTHHSTFEKRLRQPLNSWRYRPSLTFDKDIPEKIIPQTKFYLTDEVFYDSLRKKFSRNRFTVGITKILNKQLSVDLYYMRQNDGFSRPGDLHVIGTNFKIKL